MATTRLKTSKSTGPQGMSTASRNDLSESQFAFPEKRKEPLNDARHVRNAIARFDQVEDVSDKERDQAWKRITAAGRRCDVDIEVGGWRELMRGGQTGSKR